MNSRQEIILLFTKYPEPGKSKTRLISSIGAKNAAKMQEKMTELISSELYNFSTSHPCELHIYHDGGNKDLMTQWLGDSFIYKKQIAGDLGKKMSSAIGNHLNTHQSIILTGSDCPDINNSILRNAFTALQEKHVVLGPAFDGGYYLIGVQGNLSHNSIDFLFSDIIWGKDTVLQQTIERIHHLQLSYHLLKKLHDIDTPEDLRYFNNYPHT